MPKLSCSVVDVPSLRKHCHPTVLRFYPNGEADQISALFSVWFLDTGQRMLVEVHHLSNAGIKQESEMI